MPVVVSATTRNRYFRSAPSQWLAISEGTPYVVPTGEKFVLTGLGTSNLGDADTPPLVTLLADGVVEVTAGMHGCSMLTMQTAGWVVPDACTAAPVPPCISFAAGLSLTVVDGTGGNGRAWGYHVTV